MRSSLSFQRFNQVNKWKQEECRGAIRYRFTKVRKQAGLADQYPWWVTTWCKKERQRDRDRVSVPPDISLVTQLLPLQMQKTKQNKTRPDKTKQKCVITYKTASGETAYQNQIAENDPQWIAINEIRLLGISIKLGIMLNSRNFPNSWPTFFNPTSRPRNNKNKRKKEKKQTNWPDRVEICQPPLRNTSSFIFQMKEAWFDWIRRSLQVIYNDFVENASASSSQNHKFDSIRFLGNVGCRTKS